MSVINTGTISDPPIETPLTDETQDSTKPGARPQFYMTTGWYQWFLALVARIQRAAQLLQTVALTGQSAAIGTTATDIGAISSGLYRVSWYARITQAATVNSSLTVTIGWTESATSQSSSGAALVGNTTVTGQSGSVLIQSDSVAPITYATAYVSVGATPMKYRLSVTVEALQ